MKPTNLDTDVLFDHYAADYDRALAEGISISGEDKNYFARERLAWLARSLKQLHACSRVILDYGCGIGTACPYIMKLTGIESVIGLDASVKCLDRANREHGSSRSRFISFNQYEPSEDVDVAFCNGVFHHIAPSERAAAVDFIYRSLRPGGLFAFWE